MGLVYRPKHPGANANGMVDSRIAGPKHPGRPAPFVISDIMEPTRHMVTGNYHTSKSEFRKETMAAGCIEVGNETATLLKPRQPIMPDRRQRGEDIKRAIHDLRNR